MISSTAMPARAAFALAALGACGRIGFSAFDSGSDATMTDGAGDDGRPCEATEWSATITRLANLSVDGVDDWEPTVSPDERTIVFGSYRASSDLALFVSTRATPADDFAPPQIIPGFGQAAGIDVYGPAWSIDGTTLYFTSGATRLEVDYVGDGQFGATRPSTVPADSPAFASPDDVYVTRAFPTLDYDLEHWTRAAGGAWIQQALPASYNRSGNGSGNADGWPTFDRARRELYFEHEDAGKAIIVRARLDESGAVPALFESLEFLGTDLGDPHLSSDGRRMYVGATRRADTDNDIYMFERTCR